MSMVGSMMAVSMAKADETRERAAVVSPCARCAVNWLRSPLPSPMSMFSIHTSMLLMVSHTPFLYSPRQLSVRGTISSTTTADHPLMRKEPKMFLRSRVVRCSLWVGVAMSCYSGVKVLLFSRISVIAGFFWLFHQHFLVPHDVDAGRQSFRQLL